MTAPANGTARWQFWASIIPVALAILASIVGVYLASTTALTKAESLEARMTAVETLSRRNETDASVMRADLREVETQFRASDQIRNIMHANEMRTDSMLWQKTFGQPYPTDNAYFPTIAEEKSR